VKTAALSRAVPPGCWRCRAPRGCSLGSGLAGAAHWAAWPARRRCLGRPGAAAANRAVDTLATPLRLGAAAGGPGPPGFSRLGRAPRAAPSMRGLSALPAGPAPARLQARAPGARPRGTIMMTGLPRNAADTEGSQRRKALLDLPPRAARASPPATPQLPSRLPSSRGQVTQCAFELGDWQGSDFQDSKQGASAPP
jgi:hypothetical protein